MRLSVKSVVLGRVEVLQHVDTFSFQDLRCVLVQRFDVHNDFSLLCGAREMPRDNTPVTAPHIGLVDGDRLRLILNDQPLHECDRGAIRGSDGACTAHLPKQGADLVSVVLDELHKVGFFSRQSNDSEQRWEIAHERSVLRAELAFCHYWDSASPCSHLTISVLHPTHRNFLSPVVLEPNRLLHEHITLHVVSPIRIALLGHENGLLRLLGHASIMEQLMRELPVRSVLCMERTCVYAKALCTAQHSNRWWRFFLSRDFDYDDRNNDTPRETYRRLFEDRKRMTLTREIAFAQRPLHGEHMPFGPHRPLLPDPDMPIGPFQPDPSNPFLPPEHPFPMPGLGVGPRAPPNPLDPFGGSELLQSRPSRRGGAPRRIPHPFDHSPFGFM